MSEIQPDPGVRPLRAGERHEMPPAVVATPTDVPGDFDPDAPFWLPDFFDSLRLLGWRWVIVAGLVATIAGLVWVLFHGRWFVLSFAGAIIKVGTFVVGVSISLAVYLRKNATRLRKEPFCIHCGYSLAGLEDGQACPECGRRFRLRVVEEYRRDPHWFIARIRARGSSPPTGAALEAGRVASPPSGDGT